MKLTPRQENNLRNVIASTELETGPLSDEFKALLRQVVSGQRDGEEVIAELKAKAAVDADHP